MMTVPESVERLVESFHANRDALTQASYGETEVRVQFIDPLFEALGWDVRNTRGRSPGDMDVVHEDAVKVGVAHKAPDYGFYAGRERKFFVEAKRPAVNLRDSPEPAFQLRRYAWSAKLPLSVLTDFEEFVIYDARIQPRRNDSSAVARIEHITYDQYLDRWDDIAGLYSRDAVYEGSIDRWIDKQASPRGKETVDQAFLTEIERWRERLASSIALHNPELSQRELNFAVQITVDRILFLRMAEDRQTEEYGRLLGLVNGGDIYARLQGLFRQADERYNSGLFHFRPERGRSDAPDDLTPNLTIDDRTLRDIFTNLYYPNSPYEFSVLPVDVLGQVYEQFLGKVITLSSSRSVKIEEKPEVRKAGGVYYTPIYIVDYIVQHTVGKLLEGKTPRQAERLRILDPACGSGSFLIAAYQYLLDWYRDRYVEEGTDKHARKLYQAVGGEWKLTTDERKRILRNNIYGVDIDPQAVEVTKLSLLLKLLEGETRQTLNRQLSFVHERVLPDLGDNIKCGNSLIGPDFYDNPQMTLLPTEDQYRVNVFDWRAEFPGTMNRGGFDAVIGNPPWGATYNDEEKGYLRKQYRNVHVRTPESFNYFIAQMWLLSNANSTVGIIIPSSFLAQHEFWKTRSMIVNEARILRVVRLGDGVFERVTAPSAILIFGGHNLMHRNGLLLDLRRIQRSLLRSALEEESQSENASGVGENSEAFVFTTSANQGIIEKCYKWPKLREVAEDVATGVSSGLDKAFVYTESETSRLDLETELLKKLIIGGEIHRYSLTPRSSKQIIYATPETRIEDYPQCHAALLPYYGRLMKRREAANGKIPWFALNWPRRRKLFDEPKILIRQTSERIRASLDTDGWYCLKSGLIVQLPSGKRLTYPYVLGLLNSTLMHFLYNELVGEESRIFPEVKPVQLFKLPIRTIDFDSSTDIDLNNQVSSLVNRMLALNERLQQSRTTHEKTILQRQIEAIDTQIDRLVYELYDLTEEEIAIVEGNT